MRTLINLIAKAELLALKLSSIVTCIKVVLNYLNCSKLQPRGMDGKLNLAMIKLQITLMIVPLIFKHKLMID